MSDKKVGVENVKAAFTDHLSMVMRLFVDVSIVRRGKRFWKTNTSILSEKAFKKRLLQICAVWRQQRKFYPDWPLWWGRYKMNRFIFSAFRKGATGQFSAHYPAE